MANADEVRKAIDVFTSSYIPFALLHCISSYPTEHNDANLRVIETLRALYPGPVGYSDHSLGIKVPVLAVAAGACVIEKHFTLNKDTEGPDHKLSANPDELKRMVDEIRELETILGNDELTAIESERPTIVFRRPSE
jgi:sialic acid synthase SpsE